MHKMLYVSLLAAALLPACYVAPAHRGDYVVAPALPVIVEIDMEPYYYKGHYYYYHQRDRSWSYSRARKGPWMELPRDRYPREIRYKERERVRDRDRRNRGDRD